MEGINSVLISKYLSMLLITLFIFLISFAKRKRLKSSILWHFKHLNYSTQTPSGKIKFTILVPCLNEYTNITQFIEHIDTIIFNNPNIQLVFIISGKSKDIEMIRKFWEYNINCKKITYFIVPIEFSNSKAQQLNFFIKNKIVGQKNHYVVIYDADSRPDLNTFNIAESYIVTRKFPFILQQPSIFNPIGGFIQKLDGLFQTLWTFHYEIYYWTKNQKKRNNLMYVIGHGLFLRSNFLVTHPFPHYEVEDLPYGYDLTLKGIVPVILPVFDYSQTPKIFKQFIYQKAKWYRASLHSLYFAFKTVFKSNKFKEIHLIFKRLLWDLEWGFINVIVVTLFLIGCPTTPCIVVMYLLWIILYYFSPLNFFYNYAWEKGIFEIKLSISERFSLSLIYSLIYNLGPLIGLLKYIYDRGKKCDESSLFYNRF